MTRYSLGPTGKITIDGTGRELVIERTMSFSKEEIWESLTKAEQLRHWYGTIEGNLTAGETVSIGMINEADAPSEPVTILRCEPSSGFLLEAAGLAAPWRLQLQLSEGVGETTITFTHFLTEDLDPSAIGAGWEYYADRHDAYLNRTDMPRWGADRYLEKLAAHYGETKMSDEV